MFGHHHEIALWIILSCQAAIALGTVFGGWRIVKTMGSGITRLQPVGGFCAELAAATTIIGATFGKIPISTTHAITGSILGVGTTKGVRSVRWIWGQRIVMAWVLTLPCAAFMAGITYILTHLLIEPISVTGRNASFNCETRRIHLQKRNRIHIHRDPIALGQAALLADVCKHLCKR